MAINFIVSSPFSMGDMVLYVTNESCNWSQEKRIWKVGQIQGIRVWQSQHFRPDAYLLYYVICPENEIGMETDTGCCVFSDHIAPMVKRS